LKVGYITGDIVPNGHFTFFHDLLTNLPKPKGEHKVILVSPRWSTILINRLKDRGIFCESIFEEFQQNTVEWWKKIDAYTEDCDVLMSANIENLNYVLRKEFFKKPIVSVSICQTSYQNPQGGLGGNFEDYFDLAAVSRTAKEGFPEFARERVEVIYSGIDSGRVAPTVERDTLRLEWFGDRHKEMKLALFMGSQSAGKGIEKAIEMLRHLPEEWVLLIPQESETIDHVPEDLTKRVYRTDPLYEVGRFYSGADVLILPTQSEGLSMALLEAWSSELPTVTTLHDTIVELQTNHPNVDLGTLVEIDATPKDLAKACTEAVHKGPSSTARELVHQEYTAEVAVNRWLPYLEKVVERYQG